MPGPTEPFEAMQNERSIKREDTMARRPHYQSLAVTAPVRETDLTASKLSRHNQPTSSYSSANSLNGDQVLIGEVTNRKVAI